jgi:hypothetical protein
VKKLDWIKSRLSDTQGSCVQMAAGDRGAVHVRDSKNPDAGMLTFTKDEFAAWLDGAKKGEFDHLA